MENNKVRKEVMRTISELRLKGYETDTFFNASEGIDGKAYKKVLKVASKNIIEEILDAAEDGLDGYYGYIAYLIIEEYVKDTALYLVEDTIDELFFNK